MRLFWVVELLVYARGSYTALRQDVTMCYYSFNLSHEYSNVKEFLEAHNVLTLPLRLSDML